MAFAADAVATAGVALDRGGHRRRVAARLRLGERERPGDGLARAEARQVAPARGLGPEAGQRLGDHVGDRHGDPDRGVAARNLAQRERQRDRARLGAAVGRGDHHAEEAQLAERAHFALRESALAIALPRARGQLAIREGPRGLDDQALLLVGLEVHGPVYIAPRGRFVAAISRGVH